MAADFIPGQTECIHFVFSSEHGKIPTGKDNVRGIDLNPNARPGFLDVGCSPGSGLPRMATSEPAAVTCPKCKASEPFRKQQEEIELRSSGASEADIAMMREVLAQKSARLQELAKQNG